MFTLPKLEVLVVAALGLAATGCQSTGASGGAGGGTAISGRPAKLSHYANLNPDCTSAGEVVVRVTQEPGHGRAVTQAAQGYTSYTADNPRSQCNLHATPGVDLIYTSAPGYFGPDTVGADAIYASGGESMRTFNINVK